MSDASKHEQARALAERAVKQQDSGQDNAADATFDEATKLDPDAVAEVLDETGANTAPDSRDNRTDRDRSGELAPRSSGSA